MNKEVAGNTIYELLAPRCHPFLKGRKMYIIIMLRSVMEFPEFQMPMHNRDSDFVLPSLCEYSSYLMPIMPPVIFVISALLHNI